MQLSTLFDILCAAHLTAYVQSPHESRGGIILVAQGESLKTAALEVLEFYHPTALVMTDITVQSIGKLRDRMAAQAVRSLVLTDLQKIYERNPAVASNVEGALRAMVAEGFTSLAFQEQQICRARARAMVFGAVTPSLIEEKWRHWDGSGFARRFMFPLYTLRNPDVIIESVIRQKLIDLGRGVMPVPRNKTIPFDATEAEGDRLHFLLRYQPGQVIQLQVLQKVLSVLKWHYRETGSAAPARQAMATIEDFAQSLQKEGTELILPEFTTARGANVEPRFDRAAGRRPADGRDRPASTK